jgi:hypothetical protein
VHISICLSLDFSHRVFTKRCWRHKYADSVSPKLSHWVIGVFHSITGSHPSFFTLGFWRVIHDIWASTVQGGVLRINYIDLYDEQWSQIGFGACKTHGEQ